MGRSSRTSPRRISPKAITRDNVKAPIAMIGYGTASPYMEFDLTDLVDRGADRQILRLDRTFFADHGLSSGPARPMFVYLTRNPLSWALRDVRGGTVRFSGGETRPVSGFCEGLPFGALELPPGGPAEPLCSAIAVGSGSTLVTDRDNTDLTVVRMRPDGRFEQGERPEQASDRLKIKLYWSLPVLLAAIDPAAEDRLVGLNGAVDGGRPLNDADK